MEKHVKMNKRTFMEYDRTNDRFSEKEVEKLLAEDRPPLEPNPIRNMEVVS